MWIKVTSFNSTLQVIILRLLDAITHRRVACLLPLFCPAFQLPLHTLPLADLAVDNFPVLLLANLAAVHLGQALAAPVHRPAETVDPGNRAPRHFEHSFEKKLAKISQFEQLFIGFERKLVEIDGN